MKLQTSIYQLQHQAQAIINLGRNFSQEEARKKLDPQNWSALEVINHLIDEEIDDFRRHLVHILYTPEEQWPEINPPAWVTERKYNERLIDESLNQFAMEREKSITLLDNLDQPDWDRSVSLQWGFLSAGDILASWVGHDLLHLRQLISLCYKMTASSAHPYSVMYAGDW